ncbi:MAG: thioredoxin domain-containing protein [Acidobacteria bacterium]|nr:thioredoxin domain-containing protein [Acidobacteriota bacterium]
MSQQRPTLPSPKTRAQLPPDGGPNWNRLVFELSPYLLQHAANPVDWYPWGQAAFDRAKQEDKPIFLSIGYATCHWCHVMEHESFEDPQVASLLNQYFVAVKVDREERPDIDAIYMTACQAATGSGGWPLTAILNHDLKPFFVGTYFPKLGHYNRPGMMDLLPRIHELWSHERLQLNQAAERMSQHLQQVTQIPTGDMLPRELLQEAFTQLEARYDKQYGGFSQAPKFPTPHNLTFLLRMARSQSSHVGVEMVLHTLKAMRNGGIFDQVGFGFHRYATDDNWLLPHFEKMLYDQALLVIACLETFQVTHDEAIAQIARDVLTYVSRDMTDPAGGFYSAEDADSEGEEGKFYVWTPESVSRTLSAEDAKLFCDLFQIIPGGNFRDQATGAKTGESIPHLKENTELIAKRIGLGFSELNIKIDKIRRSLFVDRSKRIHPLKDDKVLTDWNGLMIAAYARAGRVLAEPEYVKSAERAWFFVRSNLMSGEHLLKRWRNGEAGLPAHLEDYAFTIWGLLELYAANHDPDHLKSAIKLTDTVITEFGDFERGGFFQTASDHTDLIVRHKDIYDGAIPSGNSVMAQNLLWLSHYTGNTNYRDQAWGVFKAFSNQVRRYPSGHTQLLSALWYAFAPKKEVVLAGPVEEMVHRLNRVYTPETVVLVHKPGLSDSAPFVAEQRAKGHKATAYVCRNFSCQAPIYDADELVRAVTEYETGALQ